MYKLFLDDERFPPSHSGPWIILRSYDDALVWVEKFGFPYFVSFDNDLGDDSKEGWQFAQWLIDRDLDHGSMPANFAFDVHSQNPVRRDDIKGRLDHYLYFRGKEWSNEQIQSMKNNSK